MTTRIEMIERLGVAIETAFELAKQLRLDCLPMLLDMARLEYLNELAADGQQPIGASSHGISSSRRDLN